ncbi:patatin-like phospholipase family protein [uncultured Nonlabens sp.]|uniref:patatin-like phospholipase family protein n=1 Tax=uncultured Nonlabens sp. TaxID=859306 RepID=UPI00262AFF81|nr:patatin-like phospholipase family protein [uncultured Nonlabens sp.]
MKIGIALSGGGVRGIAHAGVIKALQEHDITVHHVTGTSAGALVGALYAMGIDVDHIFNFFEQSNLFHPRKFAFRQAGFINSSVFIENLSPYIPENNFKCLKTPLSVTATDLNTGKLKVFKEGELYKAILASAAFPGIFTPIEIDGNLYVDGGVINNFPIDLLDDCDLKIGSYVNKVDQKSRKLKHSYDVASRAYAINQYHQDKIKFTQCDLLIEPDELGNYGLFNFKALREIFEIGYKTASRELEKTDVFDS